MADSSLQLRPLTSPSDSSRHEAKDAKAGWVLASIAMLAATIALVYVAAWWTLAAFQSAGTSAWYSSGADADHLPSEPRLEGIDELETDRNSDLGLNSWRSTNDQEKKQLESFGWVDHAKGSAHIPIRFAMRAAVDNQWFPVAPVLPVDTNKSTPSKLGKKR